MVIVMIIIGTTALPAAITASAAVTASAAITASVAIITTTGTAPATHYLHHR